MSALSATFNSRQILGLKFFNGTAAQAVDIMSHGGLLIVPSGPTLRSIPQDPAFREAVTNADLLITDSAFMVLMWNILQRDSVIRLSGLEYLRELLRHSDFVDRGNNFWIMASPASAAKNIAWLRTQGVEVGEDSYYIAPVYQSPIKDEKLLEIIRERRPKHIVMTVGGGTQEPLGLYLKRNLDYLPAIHCIGAAIAFLSGDQVHIPDWGRPLLSWLALPLSVRSQTLRSALLGRAPPFLH